MKIILILVFVVSSIYANFELVDNEFRGRPFIKNYSYMDYKGHNQVWGVSEDKRGVLYFVNSNIGVLEYDGVEWRHIQLSNKSSGRAIDIDINGIIYVGGVGDFGYLKVEDGVSKFVSLVEFIPEKYKKFEYVWECVAVEDGVYFGTDNKIYRWHNGKIDVIESENGFHITRKVNNKAYTRVFDKGIMRLDENNLTLIPNGDKFSDIALNGLLHYDDKNILVLSKDKGLFLYDGEDFKEFKSEADEFLLKNQIYDGKILDENSFVIATKNGAVVIDKDGKIKYFLNKDIGLRDNFITNLFIDSKKNLWLTLENGISKVEIPSPISLYGSFSGLQSSVNSIISYRDSLYIATMNGVYKQENNSSKESEIFKKVDGINENAWKMLKFHNLLLVATNKGIYEIDDAKAQLLNVIDDSVLDMVKSSLDENLIYLSTSSGVDIIEYKDENLTNINSIKGVDLQPWNLAINKNYLFGSSETGVVFRIELNTTKITKFNQNDGLEGANFYVSLINNNLLVSTTKGVFYFNKEINRFKKSKTFEKFKNVEKLIEDFDGNVWIRHSNPQKITFAKKIADDEKYVFIDLPFDRFGGYKFEDIFRELNIVWFGGADGLIRFDFGINNEINNTFKALIREVYFDNNKVLIDKKNQFSYSKNDIKFKYSAPYFIKEDFIKYQVFLKGYDENYSDWVDNSFVDYTNLKEGEYTFYVRAKNIYEAISKEDEYSFIILPPWYRTWFAYFIYGVLGLIFIYLIVLYQVRKAQQKAQEELKKEQEYSKLLEDKVAERTRELNENYIKLDEKSKKVNNLLNNAGQGFLSFGTNLKIDGEYSQECLKIFDRDIKNKKLSSLVFADNQSKKEFFDKTIKELLQESDNFKTNLILQLLPREFKVNNKFIFSNYKIIDNQKMMMILTDVTDKKELEEKMQQEQLRLKMVVRAITDRGELSDLIFDYKEFCNQKLQTILNSKLSLKEITSDVYREIHTFKGLFAQMDMFFMVKELHNLESIIAKFKDNLKSETIEDFKNIFENLNICLWLEKDLEILKEVLGEEFFEHSEIISIDAEQIMKIEELAKTLLSQEQQDWLIPYIKEFRYKLFSDYLKMYIKLVEKISESLEKPTYPLEIKGDKILVEPKFYNPFIKSLVHVFRNAIDHGIETIDERIELGKDEIAKIECKVLREMNKIHLIISDDGRGIDVEKLKTKAIEKGLFSKEELDEVEVDEILNFIFEDDFSTKDEISEISGRGVGLSATKYELEKIGGFVKVESKINMGTIFHFYLPIKS